MIKKTNSQQNGKNSHEKEETMKENRYLHRFIQYQAEMVFLWHTIVKDIFAVPQKQQHTNRQPERRESENDKTNKRCT